MRTTEERHQQGEGSVPCELKQSCLRRQKYLEARSDPKVFQGIVDFLHSSPRKADKVSVTRFVCSPSVRLIYCNRAQGLPNPSNDTAAVQHIPWATQYFLQTKDSGSPHHCCGLPAPLRLLYSNYFSFPLVNGY